MANITKLYAAYKAGYLGENILDTYFSFIANIILEEHLSVVEDDIIADMLQKRYEIEFPSALVRQILGVGVEHKCFVNDHGQYRVDIDQLRKFRFDESDFFIVWERLLNEFSEYCRVKEIDVSGINIREFILDVLDATDEKILAGEKVENTAGISPAEYAWYSFVKEQGSTRTNLYSFIAALSASNITKQALFYTGEGAANYSDLHVYLDSPIIFALLGMDEESRTASYKTLVEDMRKSKCNVHVLSHNFQEVDSIIARAAGWATNTQYDLRKANNAARFFHDSQMNESEISEFCAEIEGKLNDLGITVTRNDYDIYQNQFQEDESCLFDMIQARYLEHGYELTQEKKDSIRIDVRSIIMIYRERQGQTATRLQNAKHIMLTSNNAIANVSKKYESNQSINAGHIPACVSADLFGAILWLNNPMQMMKYQKQKLLADCYAFLKPDKKMIDKYIQSLDEARDADEIDEKRFLFLRTHKVVLDSLMDITKGDYARFNSNTYLEVYEDIKAKAERKYRDEAEARKRAEEELTAFKKQSRDAQDKKERENIEAQAQKDREIKELTESISEMKSKEFNRKVQFLGWFFTILLVGTPYLLSVVIIELVKTKFANVSLKAAVGFASATVATAIAGLLFAYGKKWCFNKARAILKKKV